MLSIIVAIAENYAIGKDNELLWHLPDDLKRFKKITSGNKIIMGNRKVSKGGFTGHSLADEVLSSFVGG